MGISTIYLAAALRDNGGGHLIGSELEPTKVVRARANLEAAGLADLVDIREGDALETLKDVGGEVDVLLIDGAFSLYLPVLKLIEPRLTPGAVDPRRERFRAGTIWITSATLPTAISPSRSPSMKVAATNLPCGSLDARGRVQKDGSAVCCAVCL